MKLFAYFLPWLLLATWPSCDADTQTAKTACPENLICTHQFVTIQVHLTQTNQQPVVLDSFRSTRLDTGQQWDLQETAAYAAAQGYYPILTDAQIREIEKAGSQIEFTGIKDGREVVKEVYVVGHDCCHILFISGELEIQLP